MKLDRGVSLELGGGRLSCRGMPTVHPCCVLDGRHTLGADAHDLLLSEQTRSFITATLNHCFTQLEPLCFCSGKKNGISAFWFEAGAGPGGRAAPPQFTTSVTEILSTPCPQNVLRFFFFLSFSCIFFFSSF